MDNGSIVAMRGVGFERGWLSMAALRGMALALFACFLLACAGARAQTAMPAATAHVIDQTSSLDAPQSAALETRLAEFEQERGTRVVVLIIPTTAPETVEQFGNRVAEQWRIGRQGADDGVIILVALKDRAARIEVGHGLEGVLTDAVSHRILAETMEPRFRAGDIAGGVTAGVDRVLTTLKSSLAAAPAASGMQGNDDGDGLSPFFWAAAVALTLGGALHRVLGPGRAAALMAPVGGLAGWLAGGSAAVIVAAGALAAILGALGAPFWLPRGGSRGGESPFNGGGGGASGRR